MTLEMTAAAHLRRTLGDELRIPPTNRCNPIPETRNLHESSPIANTTARSHYKIQNPTEFRSRAIAANVESSNFDICIQRLKLFAMVPSKSP